MRSGKRRVAQELRHAAGNGLLDRRALFRAGAAAAASAGFASSANATGPLQVEPWMREVGAPFTAYGQPSHFENKVVRTYASLPGTTGTGSARTPLQALDGMITPNGLHFERSHDGIPDIDPNSHQLLIHGLVRRPLSFNLEVLARYPMVSRIAFLECGGNGGALYQKAPVQLGVQGLQGLLSCRSKGELDSGRRRRCRQHEPQHPAREGDG